MSRILNTKKTTEVHVPFTENKKSDRPQPTDVSLEPTMEDKPLNTGGDNAMVITQEKLISMLAEMENMDIASVRSLFAALDQIVYDSLSSAGENRDVIIKILNGIRLECTYEPEKEVNKGMFKNQKCAPRLRAAAEVTRYYNRKLNR